MELDLSGNPFQSVGRVPNTFLTHAPHPQQTNLKATRGLDCHKGCSSLGTFCPSWRHPPWYISQRHTRQTLRGSDDRDQRPPSPCVIPCRCGIAQLAGLGWRVHFKPGRQSGPGRRCSSRSSAQRARCHPPSEIPRWPHGTGKGESCLSWFFRAHRKVSPIPQVESPSLYTGPG